MSFSVPFRLAKRVFHYIVKGKTYKHVFMNVCRAKKLEITSNRPVLRKLTPWTPRYWNVIFIYSKKCKHIFIKLGHILEQYFVSYTVVLKCIINFIHTFFLTIFICYRLRKVSNKLTPDVKCPVENTDICQIRFYVHINLLYILITINCHG